MMVWFLIWHDCVVNKTLIDITRKIKLGYDYSQGNPDKLNLKQINFD